MISQEIPEDNTEFVKVYICLDKYIHTYIRTQIIDYSRFLTHNTNIGHS